MDFPWLEFAGLMLAFLINAVIPGADFAMVLRQSIERGRRQALFTSAGVATSILVHGSYTLLGVGVIVGQSLLFFNILKWVSFEISRQGIETKQQSQNLLSSGSFFIRFHL